MTGKVISLADVRGENNLPHDSVLWRCGCGCFTHFALESGDLKCAHCGEKLDQEFGEWRRHLPDVPNPDGIEEVEAGDALVTDLDDPKWAMRRAVARANPETTCAVVIIQSDGSLSVWGDEFDTAERESWIDRRLAEVRALLIKRKS